MLNFFLKIVYSHLHKFINITIATIFLKCSPLPLFSFLLPSSLPAPLCFTHIVPILPTSNPRCYVVSLPPHFIPSPSQTHTHKVGSYYTYFDAFGFSHSMSHENVSKLTMWLLVILINSYKSSHSFDTVLISCGYFSPRCPFINYALINIPALCCGFFGTQS